jgi:HEAT repeat protein
MKQLRIACLVCLPLFLGAQQGVAPPQLPLERPQAASLSTWLAQVKGRLPVTARLSRTVVTQGFYPNTQRLRVYTAQVAIDNRSGYPLQTGSDCFLIETSRPAAGAGATAKHPFEFTMGRIDDRLVVEDYGGAVQKLDDDDPPGEFLGLGNVHAISRSGLMKWRHGDLYRMSSVPEDWPGTVRDYGQASPGQTLRLAVKHELALIVIPERQDQAALVLPAIELRDRQRSARFRYVLLLSRIGPEDNQKKNVAWRLAESKLIALTAESLLPMAGDANLPLWQRVLAVAWAGEHAAGAAEPLLVTLATAKGKENDRLRMTALGAMGRATQPDTMPRVLAIATDASEHPFVRTHAIGALGRLGDSRATEPLLKILQGKDEPDITEAIPALGALGDKAAAEPLLALLEDARRPHYHRRAAGGALARLAGNQHIGRLTVLAKSSDLIPRLAAMRALAGIGTPEAIAVLVELSSSSENAIEALGTVDQPSALAALKARLATDTTQTSWTVVKAIAALDTPERSAALREGLASSARWLVADKIGVLRVTAAASGLPPLLKDPDAEVRSQAAQALGRLQDRTAVASLLAVLSDKESSVRAAAALALGWIGAPSAVVPVSVLLKDKEVDVRSGAAKALGFLRGPQSVDALAGVLGDDHKDVRRAAAESLGRLGDPRAVEKLIPLLEDQDVGVADQAWQALYHITGEDLGSKPDAWRKGRQT